MAGAPTKLTSSVQKEIVRLIEEGCYIEDACLLAGISQSTYYNWKKWGEEGQEQYVGFLEALKKAEAEDRRGVIAKLKEHGDRDWKAEATRAERRYPDHFGRRDRHDVKHEGEIKIDIAPIPPPEDEAE